MRVEEPRAVEQHAFIEFVLERLPDDAHHYRLEPTQIETLQCDPIIFAADLDEDVGTVLTIGHAHLHHEMNRPPVIWVREH